MVLTVGYDARAGVLDPGRGLGRVAREHVRALADRSDVDLVVFVPGGVPLGPSFGGLRARIVGVPHPRRGAFLFDGPAWHWVLGRHPVDVLHLPAWGVSPGLGLPVVATLHDVTPLRYPEAIPRVRVRRRAIQRLETYRRATLVHAVSRSTAHDAVRCLGIPPGRVRVVPNGVAAATDGGPEGSRDHVLFVGGADPHKRVDMLTRLWCGPGARDLPPLVVAGGASGHPVVREAAERCPDRVLVAGTVDDGALARLYRTARVLVLPSLWEGFGLPVLEAMAHGAIPVVTACSSLPEAGGDAALYVPATAPPEAWAEAVRRIVSDGALASRLRDAGRARVARRSWEHVAEALVAVYREARILASS